MKIEEILEQFKQFDTFLDCPKCGQKQGECVCEKEKVNESCELEKKPELEKTETKDIKITEPEVDGDSVAKKLLKQLESLEDPKETHKTNKLQNAISQINTNLEESLEGRFAVEKTEDGKFVVKDNAKQEIVNNCETEQEARELANKYNCDQEPEKVNEAEDEEQAPVENITWEQFKPQVEQAVKNYMEEHKYQFTDGAFELYVDYKDTIDEETIKQIFESDKPLEAFYNIIGEWNWWQNADEEYRTIYENLNLPEEKDGFELEIKEYLQDTIPYTIPYDHFDDTVGFDVFLNNPEDANTEYSDDLIEYDGEDDSEENIATGVSGEVAKLLQLQGHTVEEFLDYVNGKGTENNFFQTLKEEIDNCTTNGGNQFVFLVQAPITEMAKAIQEQQTITIPANAICGLVDCGQGAGGTLDISLEKDITGPICDMTKASYTDRAGMFEVQYKDGYNYSVDEIFGMVASAWEADVKFHQPEAKQEPQQESVKEEEKPQIVAQYECDGNKHDIVRNKDGKYQNRYFVGNEGTARTTTQCVESLPTAVDAMMKKFPKAEQIKQ